MDQKVREALNRLSADSDFQMFVSHLTSLRDARLVELEDATVALQVNKLQGYCQAIRDVVQMCARKP
jgi:hypothetical protein